jgi:DNA-binding NtrC family response regulator
VGEVVLITAFADLDTAIEALRAGASDFILKPFRVTQALNALRRAGTCPPEARELGAAPRAVAAHAAGRRAGGRSIAIKGLQAALQRVAGGRQHRAADRRVGHRQGAGRAGAAPAQPAAAAAPSCR